MRRFLECLIPLTRCNLKCSYCYVIQEGRRKNEKAQFQYSADIIGKALSITRLGGVSLISMTASGETFLAPELPEIVREVLKQGHFVNLTTNGTLTNQIKKVLDETESFHSHLHMAFSFHYIELKNKNLIDTFFSNIKLVKDSGCSVLLQINLCDEYMPYWNDIKELSIKHLGALPQVALTRRESKRGFSIMTNKTVDEYVAIGKEMNSPLFDFTCKNFNVKRREFCYAGYWSGKLNLATGIMTGCYGDGISQNIFADLSRPIKWRPVGHHCSHKYCVNSSHFLSQGIIPELLPLPSYADLRNRAEAHWYTDEMKDFLGKQFEDENPLLSKTQMFIYDKAFYLTEMKKMCIKLYKKIKR